MKNTELHIFKYFGKIEPPETADLLRRPTLCGRYVSHRSINSTHPTCDTCVEIRLKNALNPSTDDSALDNDDDYWFAHATVLTCDLAKIPEHWRDAAFNALKPDAVLAA